MAMVTRKIRHKNGDGSIVEAEIGAKAENVLEDENHRFATDAEKTSWNGKVDSDGGDIANTKVSEFAASSAQWPVPAAGESPKTLWGKVKKFIEDFKNWMAGVCLIGQIVNDCVTNNANLPLSAAQGKVLMDLYTVLNANLSGKATSGTAATFLALELNADTPYIDFHYGKSSADYTSRIIETAPGIINVAADLKENGNRVATAENTQVKFRNDGGFLTATLDLTDIGCIPTIQGHKMNYSWNSGLQRMYVWMDGIELGYIPFAK